MKPADAELDSYEIIQADNSDDYSISAIKVGSVSSQIAVGGISGWCIGHICKRVGLLAGTTVGGGLIAMKLASDRGYIKINWTRVNTDIQHATDKLKEAASNSSNGDIMSSQATAEMRIKSALSRRETVQGITDRTRRDKHESFNGVSTALNRLID